jgi:hypothetical protein
LSENKCKEPVVTFIIIKTIKANGKQQVLKVVRKKKKTTNIAQTEELLPN